uniref:Rieske domain-containing protein n=1 Tax=Oryza punctata TaxID=4537 RepID=A0A0E0KKF2_ORYPU
MDALSLLLLPGARPVHHLRDGAARVPPPRLPWSRGVVRRQRLLWSTSVAAVAAETPRAEDAPSPSPSGEERFDWLDQWYPVAPVCDLDPGAPHGKTVLGLRIVAWFDRTTDDGGGGEWRVFDDSCPHRLAPLSEGRVDDKGRLQCVYHGWCFDGRGACQFILRAPALGPAVHKNSKACVASYPCVVQNNILWFYPRSEPEYKDILQRKRPPYIPQIDDPSFVTVYGIRDLPYGYDVLVENLMDPAHVPYAHKGLMLEFDKEGGGPMKMEIEEANIEGFLSMQDRGFFKFDDQDKEKKKKKQPTVMLVFLCIPVSPGRSRVVWAFPRNVGVWMDKIIPRWYYHIGQNAILDSDIYLLHIEERNFATVGIDNWQKACYVPTSSDNMIITFRNWFRKYCKHQVGWAAPTANQLPPTPTKDQLLDRYWSHVMQCTSCSAALKRMKALEVALQVASVAVVGFLAVAKGTVVMSVVQRAAVVAAAVLCFAASRWLANFIEKNFYFQDYVHAYNSRPASLPLRVDGAARRSTAASLAPPPRRPWTGRGVALRLPASVSAVSTAETGTPPVAEEAQAPAPVGEERFDWLDQWYPVAPVCDLDPRKPHGKTVMGLSIVAWFDGGGEWRVVDDACPHRLAPLSEGRVDDKGRLQCAYHGWCFDGRGSCQFIPQAPALGPPVHKNSKACVASYPSVVQNNILWFYPRSEPEYRDVLQRKRPPYFPDLDDPSFNTVFGVRDFPYGYDMLVENLMDPAHVPYAHKGLFPQFQVKEDPGRYSSSAILQWSAASLIQNIHLLSTVEFDQERGGPVKMKIEEANIDGFLSIQEENWGQFRFIAPCTINRSELPLETLEKQQQQPQGMLVFLCVPVAPGRSRVIWAFPQSVGAWPDKIIPRWLHHIVTNTILDSDLYLLHIEERNFARVGLDKWQKACYVPTSSDNMIITFRNWFRKYCKHQVGWATSMINQLPPTPTKDQLMERYWSHVMQCTSCSAALKWMRAMEIALQVASVAVLGFLAAGKGTVATSAVQRAAVVAAAALCFAASRWLANFIEKSFYFQDYITFAPMATRVGETMSGCVEWATGRND